MRRKFEVWAHSALYACSLEEAVWKSSKTIARRKLRNGFIRYKKKVQEIRRLEYVRNKINWFGDVRDKKSLEQILQAWKNQVKLSQKAKRFLLRSIKGVDSLITNDAFTVWKTAMFQARRQVYLLNIEELSKR